MKDLKIELMRPKATYRARGISRSALYNDVAQGLWTNPVKLGKRASGWPRHEVDALNLARIGGMSEEDIRRLVRTLENRRKQASSEIADILSLGMEVMP